MTGSFPALVDHFPCSCQIPRCRRLLGAEGLASGQEGIASGAEGIALAKPSGIGADAVKSAVLGAGGISCICARKGFPEGLSPVEIGNGAGDGTRTRDRRFRNSAGIVVKTLRRCSAIRVSSSKPLAGQRVLAPFPPVKTIRQGILYPGRVSIAAIN